MSRTFRHTKKQKLKQKEWLEDQQDWDFMYAPSKEYKRSRNRSIKAKTKQKIKDKDYEFDPDKKSHRYQWNMDW